MLIVNEKIKKMGKSRDMYTVSFFGHRQIDDLRDVDRALIPILDGIFSRESHTVFLIGRNGEFDEYAASVIKRARRDFEAVINDLTLVLPYDVADIEYYENYYDGIVIPEELHGVHPKAAIRQRNRWMIERSDLVIVCVTRARGGAYDAMNYANSLGKNVVNIAHDRNY